MTVETREISMQNLKHEKFLISCYAKAYNEVNSKLKRIAFCR